MNQRIVLGTILVFALTLFTQCTIQKRVYRKGYYISFHHHRKQVDTDKNEKQLATIPALDSLGVKPELVSSETASSIIELPVTTDSVTNKLTENPVVHQLKTTVEQLKKTFVKKREAMVQPARLYNKKAKEGIDPSVGFFMVLAGVVLIFIGFMLALLSILLTETLMPWMGALIIGAGLLLIVVGLVVGISGNSREKTEKKQAEISKKKKERAELSEEEWTDLKEQQYKKAIRATALLVVLFFAISLFAIAIGEPMPLIAITGAMFLIFIAFVWGTYKSKRPENPAVNTER
jgi:hypothetical protein